MRIGVNLSLVQMAVRQMLGGSAPWTPASLFASSEPGVWYDPSDLTTLFEDAAGTIPITTVEKPVGLMLDKSKGLAVGTIDVLDGNGNFNNPSYWFEANNVSSITDGQLVFNGSSVLGGKFAPTASLVIGKYYEVSFDITNFVQGGAKVWVGHSGPAYTANTLGTHKYRLACTGDTYVRVYSIGGVATTLTIDNVVVKEVTGNHAYQTTSTSRPVLSARYNLLTKTEQFDDGGWVKLNATVTANAVVAPDGTMTGDSVIATTISGNHTVYSGALTPTGSSVALTHSVYVKANGYSKVALREGNGAPNSYAAFDLSTGSIIEAGSATTNAAITEAGNGFYRISATFTATTQRWMVHVLDPAYTTGSVQTNWEGDGTSGIYIWGAQLEQAT